MRPAIRRLLAFTAACLLAVTLRPATAHAQTTALLLDSQPGDPIGQGQTRTWTDDDLTFVITAARRPREVFVGASTVDRSISWSLSFVAPEPSMGPGVYENAIGPVFDYQTTTTPQLDVDGPGPSCGRASGRFVVYEFEVTSAGEVSRFAADFEQHCGVTVPALFGAIRFNSTRATLIPFDGAYPDYSLTVGAAVNGYVTAPGIDCGAGRTDCHERYSTDTLVALRAVPSAGFIFLGWAGDCGGSQDGTVVVRWRRFCTPVFNRMPGAGGAEFPDYSQAALFLDGTIGLPEFPLPSAPRARQVYAAFAPGSPNRSAVRPEPALTNVGRHVAFTVDGPRGVSYSLLFGAPSGSDLTPGAEYDYAVAGIDDTSPVPGLRLVRIDQHISCGSGGRFKVHEVAFEESSNAILSFAADFEVPCGPDALIAGSLRYRSTTSSLLPFDGQYPRYALRVVPKLGGYVSSLGILCGDNGPSDCDETYDSPSVVSLQAYPSIGYQFVAWAGSCTGSNSTTTVVVDHMKRCFPVFAARPGSGAPSDISLADATLLLVPLGAASSPHRTVWLGGDSRITGWGDASAFSVTFTSDVSGASGNVFFRIPNGSLGLGDYEYGHTTPNTFHVSGCYVRGARIRIYELAIDTSGSVLALAADFEAVCDFSSTPRIAGAVRINSTRAAIVPFDGAYPIYKLAIEPAINGLVTGPGIDCGPGRADCAEIFTGPTSVALALLPQAGYRFVGWSGDCEGGTTTTIAVDWIRRCSAVYDPIRLDRGVADPRVSVGSFFIDSEAGDPLGQGLRRVWLDAVITHGWSDRRSIIMNIITADGDFWRLSLSATQGQHLQPKAYDNAVHIDTATSSPGFHVWPPNGGCPSAALVQARFIVHEISFSPSTSSPSPFDTVTSLAVDFEERCSPDHPPIKGSIRFNSTRSVLTPFASTSFTPVPPPLRADFNGDRWADLVWRHTVSGRNAIWLMQGAAASLTTVLTPSAAGAVPDLKWEIRAVGDMNGDTRPDLIWQHDESGRIAVWFMSGTACIGTDYLTTATATTTEPDLDWKIVAAGDMDRDGQVDLVWRHRTSGEIRLWHMIGNVQWDSVPIATVTDRNWEIVGLADMSGDGMLDLVWRHAGNGAIASWFMSDAIVQLTLRMSPAELTDLNWRMVGVVDMNADSKPDLVWQHLTTGELGVWFMDGITMVGGQYLVPARVSDPKWRIVGVR